MSNPSLQAKLDAIFNAHMNAELAGDLDETLATNVLPNPGLQPSAADATLSHCG